MKLCSKKNAAVLGALLTLTGGASLFHLSRPAHAQLAPIGVVPLSPAPALGDYKPPVESVARLGAINNLLPLSHAR